MCVCGMEELSIYRIYVVRKISDERWKIIFAQRRQFKSQWTYRFRGLMQQFVHFGRIVVHSQYIVYKLVDEIWMKKKSMMKH